MIIVVNLQVCQMPLNWDYVSQSIQSALFDGEVLVADLLHYSPVKQREQKNTGDH